MTFYLGVLANYFGICHHSGSSFHVVLKKEAGGQEEGGEGVSVIGM